MADHQRSQAKSSRHGRRKPLKCFIIRLKDNTHSCKMAQDCYDQAIKLGITPEFFDAINGNEADEHYTITGVKPKRKMKKGRPGVLGCFFSHYYLWLKCIQLNTALIILEHDGYLLRSIDSSILNKFEDVLKLDRLDPFSKLYNQELDNEKNKQLIIEKYINSSNKNPDKIGTGNYFKGAYAYIIKPSGAKKIVSHIEEHGHVPADQQIGDWILDTKTTVPSVARLHPFYAISNNIKTASLTKNLKDN